MKSVQRNPRSIALLLLLVVTVALVVINFVANGRNAPAATSYGDALSLGNGEIRSFVTMGDDGNPQVIGLEFDAAALTGLPTNALSDGTWDIPAADGSVAWACCGFEFVLTPPAGTPFEHIVVNWNPGGHPPPGVYNTPHFDMHFYLLSNAERSAIAAPASAAEMCSDAAQFPEPYVLPFPLTCDVAATALAPVPAAQMPPDYISPGAVEPGMGNHLLDVTSPELGGEPFTHTFIFGSWDGAVSFFEPMITLAYLQQLDNEACFALKMPTVFAEAGAYPTRYCMSFDADSDRYQVTLDQFASYPGE